MANSEHIIELNPVNSDGEVLADGVEYTTIAGIEYDEANREHIIPLLKEGDSADIIIDIAPLPISDFDGSPREGEVEIEVQFSYTGSYGESFLWDFGDGQTSGEENPSHNFTYGDYSVSLQVYEWLANDYDIEIKENYVQVTLPPALVLAYGSSVERIHVSISEGFEAFSNGETLYVGVNSVGTISSAVASGENSFWLYGNWPSDSTLNTGVGVNNADYAAQGTISAAPGYEGSVFEAHYQTQYGFTGIKSGAVHTYEPDHVTFIKENLISADDFSPPSDRNLNDTVTVISGEQSLTAYDVTIAVFYHGPASPTSSRVWSVGATFKGEPVKIDGSVMFGGFSALHGRGFDIQKENGDYFLYILDGAIGGNFYKFKLDEDSLNFTQQIRQPTGITSTTGLIGLGLDSAIWASQNGTYKEIFSIGSSAITYRPFTNNGTALGFGWNPISRKEFIAFSEAPTITEHTGYTYENEIMKSECVITPGGFSCQYTENPTQPTKTCSSTAFPYNMPGFTGTYNFFGEYEVPVFYPDYYNVGDSYYYFSWITEARKYTDQTIIDYNDVVIDGSRVVRGIKRESIGTRVYGFRHEPFDDDYGYTYGFNCELEDLKTVTFLDFQIEPGGDFATKYKYVDHKLVRRCTTAGNVIRENGGYFCVPECESHDGAWSDDTMWDGETTWCNDLAWNEIEDDSYGVLAETGWKAIALEHDEISEPAIVYNSGKTYGIDGITQVNGARAFFQSIKM